MLPTTGKAAEPITKPSAAPAEAHARPPIVPTAPYLILVFNSFLLISPRLNLLKLIPVSAINTTPTKVHASGPNIAPPAIAKPPPIPPAAAAPDLRPFTTKAVPLIVKIAPL